jgi:isopropylmalate/homocitrate/citramalate synthase
MKTKKNTKNLEKMTPNSISRENRQNLKEKSQNNKLLVNKVR